MSEKNTQEGSRLFGTHSVKAVEMRPIAALVSWDLNPRDDEEKGGEGLGVSLQEDGQIDDVHVMLAIDAEVILRGHRRVRAMRKIGWTECRQVVHKFSDLRDAYRFAIIDHGHTVALNGHEKLTMVTNAEKLGIDGEDLAATLGVKRETITKYHELALNLPMCARVALSDERLSMNTAELLLDVPDAKQRRDAAQMIMKDMETGEPMAHGQAKAFIQAHYVLPEKWRREWLETELKLKKKYKVSDGHHYVEWAARWDYIMGESGQPEPEFEFATSFLPRDREGRTFGEVAKGLGVPIYVVPAPLHKDGYVALVQASMLRDAMSIPSGNDETRITNDEADQADTSSKPDVKAKTAAADVIVKDAEEQLRMWLRTWLGAIYEALLMNPTDVMTKDPWLPLQEFLAHLTTDVDAGALHAWLGIDNRKAAQEWIASDTKNRAHLRTTLMLLVCAESDASSQPEKVIRAVAASLGVDGKGLDKKLAKTTTNQ